MLKEVVIGIILFSIILIPFVKKLELQYVFYDNEWQPVFHNDESYWLISSKYFKLFFIDKDLHDKQWGKMFTPPVGSYIIGLALSIAGYGDKIEELGKMKRWDSLRDYKWNLDHGRDASPKILYVARLAIALFGSLTCLLIYWIGRKIFDVKVGIIA